MLPSAETSNALAGTVITENARISDSTTANIFLDIGIPPFNYTYQLYIFFYK